ncbi:DNA polymerase IV [Rothia sp. AR01]|uniref:DNA polymerase IV n=1 Tax=Rothia santali TaxID=2949643 RepID=A0A9X2KIP9_9MICC|nr:DNA polymerase IV [Rothia santali]MCP3426473.1 DNA polymerase IV [Rothia santali]
MADAEPDFRDRVILHVDMDAFFVNVELLQRPELRGRQVVVAGSGPRSVVLSASYEARALGVGSAMPTARARSLAPHAVYLEPSHGGYREYSRRVMEILRSVTDLVEQVSVDEAFLDVTGARRRLGGPVAIARGIRREILESTGLVASIGVAGNKFIAKMASTGSKPDGLWLVPDRRILEFLDPLPVRRLWGVGEKTAASLDDAGLRTSADVRGAGLEYLRRRLGQAAGTHLHQIVRGIDDRPVVVERLEKSMGAEHTFSYDTDDLREILAVVLQLSHDVARRLRRSGRRARGVAIKVRDRDFTTHTRSRALDQGVTTGREVYEAARRLLEDMGPLPSRVRLIGVRVERLDEGDAGRQLSLWDGDGAAGLHDAPEWDGAESAMDVIREKFGPQGLQPARLVTGKISPRYAPDGRSGSREDPSPVSDEKTP